MLKKTRVLIVSLSCPYILIRPFRSIQIVLFLGSKWEKIAKITLFLRKKRTICTIFTYRNYARFSYTDGVAGSSPVPPTKL